MRTDIVFLAFGLQHFRRMGHGCSRGIDKAGDGVALSARGFDAAGSLGFQKFAAGTGSELFAISVVGRDSS